MPGPGVDGEAGRLRAESLRLAELERIKAQFLNLVAHELRGPLAVARGYTSMLLDGTYGPPSAVDLRAAGPVIAAKLEEMGQLVDQMIETARLEDDQLHLKREVVDLREVVHAALRMMTPLVQRHQLLTRWLPGEVRVLGDRDRLLTILTNLLDNACKYSPPGTDVELTCGLEAGMATAAVADHGFGIAAEDLPRLFTRFGRIVTRQNGHIPGTGLGLYLCRELARMHGGTLDATSEVDAGSVFTLRLPPWSPLGTQPPEPSVAMNSSGEM